MFYMVTRHAASVNVLVPLKDVNYERDPEMVACPPHHEFGRWRINFAGTSTIAFLFFLQILACMRSMSVYVFRATSVRTVTSSLHTVAT